jgi:hypothetical protein
MNKKLEYELSENLQSPSFSKIQSQAMSVFRLLEKDSQAYKECEKLFEVIDEQQGNMDSIKSLMYLISGKM